MLKPAMPNPFNPQTTLNFSLKADATVELAVFNLRGELVRQLLSERRSAGEHSVVWNGRDRSGSALASGVYLARFVAGDVVMTQRLVLVQ
jgi:flagellar hook assembly protein FlgD